MSAAQPANNAEVVLSPEQQAKLDEANAQFDVVEKRLRDLEDAETSHIATASAYAAFDASMNAARLEFLRLCWIVDILKKGGDCAWQK